MQLSRRNFVKGAALAAAGGAGVLAGLSAPVSQAIADPVGSGSIGLTFDENQWVLVGQSVSGRVYSYDIGGADAFDLTFDYDASVFAGISVSAPAGATILAENDDGGRLQVIFMVDPASVDYDNLLTVTVSGSSSVADGAINLVAAKAAKLGGTIQLDIIGGTNTIGVRPFDPISEFTIENLSMAMTFFMVGSTSPRWPDAARFDMNGDSLIDLADFVRIANGILDASSNLRLRFNADGKFKILQVSDYQDYINTTTRRNVNARTVALFNALLDSEEPDLVVMTGDQIGGNMNADLLQEYIRQMMLPCEERGIPWMITYGNHDEDATTALASGWDKVRQLDYYRSFPMNVNRPTMSGCVQKNGNNTSCVGDMYLFLYDSEGDAPIYNLWALDSNRYRNGGLPAVTKPVPYGSNITGTAYDWIRPQQVEWYYRTSVQIENRYGKLNSLMFFHIPLLEWTNMWLDKDRYSVVGRRGEVECPPFVNTGLYAAAYERGDVRGMFVGHEHDNDYIGNYHGIYLSYDASIGYATYGGEWKGGKVIELDKSNLGTFTTRMIYASEYGLNS
ncbi:MAG: metallophosphoesterase [Coriobacteriia bacterium]|nr:metallophosphoesterase [Coriobacteriia bacterium]